MHFRPQVFPLIVPIKVIIMHLDPIKDGLLIIRLMVSLGGLTVIFDSLKNHQSFSSMVSSMFILSWFLKSLFAVSYLQTFYANFLATSKKLSGESSRFPLSFPFPDRRSVPNEPRSSEESLTLTMVQCVLVYAFSGGFQLQVNSA